MALSCPYCSRSIEFSGEPPSYCAYCGQRLSDPRFDETIAHQPVSGVGPLLVGAQPRGEDLRLEVGQLVAGYRLVRALGSGGMGSVFEAEDVRSGRRVALKMIAPQFVASRDAVERFRQEGRLASTLEHPRCVFVLAADEIDGYPYIVMELMPGGTLQSLVEERGPLPVEEAITKGLDVIDGLREAHRLGVVHRDVKPSNCFLQLDGRLKVGDFGLSKSLTEDAHLTRTGAFIGTPLYASPEQIKGDAVDERTDIYSVAATLYFALAGRPPFREKDATATVARIVSESPPPLRSLRPEVPPQLETTIHRGLDRDRERRWRDLDSFRAALLPFITSRISISGIGLRVWAFLLDLILFMAVYLAVLGLAAASISSRAAEGFADRYSGWIGLVSNLVAVAYFAFFEGTRGASLGKWLAGLRVCRVDQGDRPVRVERWFEPGYSM